MPTTYTTYFLLIFPYHGMKNDKASQKYFRRLIKLCRQVGDLKNITIVYDQKSAQQEDNEKILRELAEKGIEIVRGYGVDTCQNWLNGWGHVLDKPALQDSDRVILLPGDLMHIQEEKHFFKNLKKYITDDSVPLVVGDFIGSDPLGTKELIDLYGVYPLVANWFPIAWKSMQRLNIKRVRSEFLNIRVLTLRQLLKRRAFAYAQSLNFLILLWYQCMRENRYHLITANNQWAKTVKRIPLGTITDDTKGRYYRGAVDQIERVERMLRILWRELKNWDNNVIPLDDFEALATKYEQKSLRSTNIRDAARIAIWAHIR